MISILRHSGRLKRSRFPNFVPEYFAEDLFSLLGENGRPDYRWIIMGPEKSGSTFHKVSSVRSPIARAFG